MAQVPKTFFQLSDINCIGIIDMFSGNIGWLIDYKLERDKLVRFVRTFVTSASQ